MGQKLMTTQGQEMLTLLMKQLYPAQLQQLCQVQLKTGTNHGLHQLSHPGQTTTTSPLLMVSQEPTRLSATSPTGPLTDKEVMASLIQSTLIPISALISSMDLLSWIKTLCWSSHMTPTQI